MPDLGIKHECASCGTKFYDLGRADAICPKCGLNPITDEVEEIPEEKPAAEEGAAAEAEDDGDVIPADDDEDVGIDLDEDEGGDGDKDE